MTSQDIIEILFRETERHRFQIANVFLYRWECDFFAIAPFTDMAYEFEVKISRSDFRADFEKKEKHRLFADHKKPYLVFRHNTHEGSEFMPAYSHIRIAPRAEALPNHFYYVAPAGIIPREEVPRYAGLIEITEDGRMVYVKKAPKLHKDKFCLWRELLEKYYWQWFNAKKEIKRLQKKNERRNQNAAHAAAPGR